MMKALISIAMAGIVLSCGLAASPARAADSQPVPHEITLPVAAPPASLPDAAPSPAPLGAEPALQAYERRAEQQQVDLGSYTDTTIIEAELISTKQKGEFELERSFQAPRSMAFKALRFVGDGFIKNNVIVRWLQSEVDRAQKGDGAATALTSENYRFAFKGGSRLDDRPVYVYQVKPRHKAPGLFKGEIFLDPYSGRIRRAQGRLVKSPSVFLKKIEFVQDYGDFGEFTLPVHMHSEVSTRIVGRAVMDIQHSDYQARSLSEIHAADGGGGSGGAN